MNVLGKILGGTSKQWWKLQQQLHFNYHYRSFASSLYMSRTTTGCSQLLHNCAHSTGKNRLLQDEVMIRHEYQGTSVDMKHGRNSITASPSSSSKTLSDNGEKHDKIDHDDENDNAARVKREEELLRIAKPKYDAIHDSYVAMPSLKNMSNSSDNPSSHDANNDSNNKEMELDIRQKRLIYRSKQRGWLEVDLLLGMYAHQHVPQMSTEEMDEFEQFVNLETVDIYNVLTLRSGVAQEFGATSRSTEERNYGKMNKVGGAGVVQRLQQWAKSNPLGRAEPTVYASAKMDNNLT